MLLYHWNDRKCLPWKGEDKNTSLSFVNHCNTSKLVIKPSISHGLFIPSCIQ